MTDSTTSRQRAVEQVAILFPYLTPAERFEWWQRLGCSLTELTVNMPTLSDRLAAEQDMASKNIQASRGQ